MRLVLYHPHIARRTCQDCQQWLYDERTGERVTRQALPIARPVGVLTPCRSCPKVPTDAVPVATSAVELTPQNWQCYVHYLGCAATGQWPDDGLVRLHAGVIAGVIDEYRAWRAGEPLIQLARVLRVRGV